MGDKMGPISIFYRFGAALAIGLLVGLEREYAHGGPEGEIFAGARTFALLGLAGCGAALAADVLASPWAFIGILLPLGALITVAYFIDASGGEVGMTTEVAKAGRPSLLRLGPLRCHTSLRPDGW
jgi:hypothetical protein